MSTTHSIRTVTMASKGNLGLYAQGAPGTAIYAAPSEYGADDAQILVPPGQYVVMDVATKLSLDNTATKTANPNIKIGLAIDLNGDGISDTIRWHLETSSGCAVESMEAELPTCGVASIVDVFPRCVKCGETYTIQVRAYRPDLDPYASSPGIGNVYDFSYQVPCGGCEDGDCPDEVNADVLMCGMANVIDGINTDPNWDVRLNSMPFEVKKHDFPFTVAQLYNTGNTTYELCLTESDASCADCVNLPDIAGFSSASGNLDITFSPATFVTEGGVKVSKRAHWELAANLITKHLAGKGKAVFLPAVGNCCTNHKLEVNSCLTDLVFKDGDGNPIALCGGAATSPFAAVTIYNECKDCDNAASESWTPTIGWRFYAKAQQARCGCVADNYTLAEYFTEIEVFPKYGFVDGGVAVIKRQESTLPTGQGFQWQAVELYHLEEYAGETFVEDNYNGKHGEPELNDRLNHVTTNCRDSYCAVTLTQAQLRRRDISGRTHAPKVTSHFLMPKADTTTQTQMLAFLNAYFAGEECGVATVACS